MKITEIKIQSKSQTILNESWASLTESQQNYVHAWERQVWPLLKEYIVLHEQQLSRQQIYQIFQQAEQQSKGNRTAIGKAADVISKIDDTLIKLGKKAQQAGPVKDMDAKFDKLKADIAEKSKDSKILKGVEFVSQWAKKHPTQASFAVGILTTIAAFAGGPAGGAAAGLILRSTKGLLQGEQLSQAVGKSIRITAYGAMAGWAIQTVGNWLEGMAAQAVPYEKIPGLTRVDVNLMHRISAPGFSEVRELGTLWIPSDAQSYVSGLLQSAQQGSLSAFNELFSYSQGIDLPYELEKINIQQGLVKQLAQQNSEFLNGLKTLNQTIAAIAQGSVTGKLDSSNVKVKTNQSNSNDKIGEQKILQVMQILSEDSGWRDKIAQFGKNLTNKITADKLLKAWQQAGSPDDSNQLAGFLMKMGVDEEKISNIYSNLNISTQPSEEDPTEDDLEISDDQKSTNVKPDAEVIAKYLFGADQKQLQAFIAVVDEVISISESFLELKQQIPRMTTQQAEKLIAEIDQFAGK